MSKFEATLNTLPDPNPFPASLPLAHTTVARWFGSIVDDGHLEPRLCTVFNETILYLFYGGLFYRPSFVGASRDLYEVPIGFVFHPKLLERVSHFFPFDTGAMATGKFFHWSTEFGNFQSDYRAPGGSFRTPAKMVHHLFGTNEDYLRHRANPGCLTKPEPLPKLYDFYTDDLQKKGCDHRQCVFECQIREPLDLGTDLLWIGYPEQLGYLYRRLCQRTAPHKPIPFPYVQREIMNPVVTAGLLQEEALRRFEYYAAP
jgi:hypothetical protein